ncbi:MAG: ABC transporter permease subunit [Planctomycetota bacterium]|jgi:ABC-2 type transport system permease protein
MNRAIWKKAFSDAWLPLGVSSIILILFSWLFVWLVSQFDIGLWGLMLRMMPGWVEDIIGVPLDEIVTTTGRLSFLYVHAITMLVCMGWAVGRGSASISGEIARGTMDLILSLPVRRATVVAAPAVVAGLGGAVLAGSITAGIWLGLLTVDLPGKTSLSEFLPGAVNLFCLIFCMTGVTTFVSSWNRDRWRTVSLAVVVYVVFLIIDVVASLWPPGSWLQYCTFVTAFHPQLLILQPEETGWLAWKYNVPLLVLGLIAYAGAVAVFSYRDIPEAK